MTERPPQTQQRCGIPSRPTNGCYLFGKSQCQSGQHCEIPDGLTELSAGNHIVLTCNNGYKVDGAPDVFCGSNGKLSNDPECIEIRCKALTTDSMVADCSHNNTWISCESSVPLGTTATVFCQQNYRPTTTGIATDLKRLTCVGNGEWDWKPVNYSAAQTIINIHVNGTTKSWQNLSKDIVSVPKVMNIVKNVSTGNFIDPVPTVVYPGIDPRTGP